MVRQYRQMRMDTSLYDLLSEEKKRIFETTGVELSLFQVQQKIAKDYKLKFRKMIKKNGKEDNDIFRI